MLTSMRLFNYFPKCIARGFGPTRPDSVADLEFPNSLDRAGRPCRETVGHWKYTVAIGYDSIDQIHSSQVTEMRWYKNVDRLEHEYIVVTCRRAETETYLRLECRPSSSDSHLVTPEYALPLEQRKEFTRDEWRSFKADVQGEQKFIHKTVWTLLQRSAPSYKNALVPVDSVVRVPNLKGFVGEESQLVAHYQSFQKPFCVRDLAFLANTINSHMPNCQFFMNQAYRFVQMVTDMAVAIYQPTALKGPRFPDAGTYTVRKTPGSRPLRLNQSHEGNSEELATSFKAALEVHNQQVHNKYYERVGKLKDLEQQIEEERRKRREAEERLAAARREGESRIGIRDTY